MVCLTRIAFGFVGLCVAVWCCCFACFRFWLTVGWGLILMVFWVWLGWFVLMVLFNVGWFVVFVFMVSSVLPIVGLLVRVFWGLNCFVCLVGFRLLCVLCCIALLGLCLLLVLIWLLRVGV